MKKNILTFSLLVISITSLLFISFRISNGRWRIPEGLPPVALEVYQNDKKQIIKLLYNNIEYYRMHYDLYRYSHNPDPGFHIFKSYIEQYSEELGTWTVSPVPAKDQYEITIDTIVYSNNGLRCIAFVVTRKIDIKQSEYDVNCESDIKFDAWAWIGIRTHLNDQFKIAPSQTFAVLSFSGESAVKGLEELYYTKLKEVHSMQAPFSKLLFEQNVGDSAFFEKAPYFQMFDRNKYEGQICFDGPAYIFQIYYSLGRFYKIELNTH